MNKLFYFSMAILATLVFATARAAPDPLDTINININGQGEQPPPPPESAPSRCICINPWPGSLIGDPARLCRNKGMCYVTCNLACRDEEVARGVGRCQSRIACDDEVLPKEKERGLSRESPKIFPTFQETRKGTRFQGSPPFLDSDYLSPGPMCTCENPWANTPNWFNGDPALLCRTKGMCYVDCNYGCRDQEATAAGAPARCESKVACEVLKGKKGEEK